MNLKNKKFLLIVGFEPGPFGLQSEPATTELRVLMSVSGLKFTGFYLSIHLSILDIRNL